MTPNDIVNEAASCEVEAVHGIVSNDRVQRSAELRDVMWELGCSSCVHKLLSQHNTFEVGDAGHTVCFS